MAAATIWTAWTGRLNRLERSVPMLVLEMPELETGTGVVATCWMTGWGSCCGCTRTCRGTCLSGNGIWSGCCGVTIGWPASKVVWPGMLIGVPTEVSGCCGWKLGGTGWSEVSVTVYTSSRVHLDESAGVIAPLAAFTATQACAWMRVPHCVAPCGQHVVGHSVHGLVSHLYVVHGGTVGHGCCRGLQFWHKFAETC